MTATETLNPRMDPQDHPAWISILESLQSEIEVRPFTGKELERVERYHNSPRQGKWKKPPKYRVIRLDGKSNGEVIGFERPRNEFYASLATQLDNWITGTGSKSSFDFPFSDKQWRYVERIAGSETIDLYNKINAVTLTCPQCGTQIEAYTTSINLKCLVCDPGSLFLTPADLAERQELESTPRNTDEVELDPDLDLSDDDESLFVD